MIPEYDTTGFLWIKTLHIIAVITWMAGLFYLPRLFVYHAQVAPGTEISENFKVMERRLLKAIMHPSLVVVVITGFWMFPHWWTWGWMHLKILLVAGLVVCHVYYTKWQIAFANDRNVHPHKFYRVMNEVPTLLLLAIIPLVVFGAKFRLF